MDLFFVSAKTPCNLPERALWEILKMKEKSPIKELLDFACP